MDGGHISNLKTPSDRSDALKLPPYVRLAQDYQLACLATNQHAVALRWWVYLCYRIVMSRRARVVKESGEAVFALLKLTSATADAFPPLKSAAGGALHIAELVVVRIYL